MFCRFHFLISVVYSLFPTTGTTQAVLADCPNTEPPLLVRLANGSELPRESVGGRRRGSNNLRGHGKPDCQSDFQAERSTARSDVCRLSPRVRLDARSLVLYLYRGLFSFQGAGGLQNVPLIISRKTGQKLTHFLGMRKIFFEIFAPILRKRSILSFDGAEGNLFPVTVEGVSAGDHAGKCLLGVAAEGEAGGAATWAGGVLNHPFLIVLLVHVHRLLCVSLLSGCNYTRLSISAQVCQAPFGKNF